jgi:hypothetical protein
MADDGTRNDGGIDEARRDMFVEIASMEHPRLLAAAIDEAQQRGVPLGRVSQGSGSYCLTDAELAEMVALAHEAAIELFMFISSRNSFEQLVDPHGGDELRGEAAFADAVEELHRCVAFGVDGVLIPDIGLLATAGEMIRDSRLGPLKLKSSASIAPRNAATAALYVQLGATSINTASSSTVDDLAAMREAIGRTATLDVYVESPDAFGGGLRYREVAELVRRVAPIGLKFGLRNAPSLYPYGQHLEPMASVTIREKIRRAEIALERLQLQRAAPAEPAGVPA